jgi:hypothetical protein
LRVQVHQFDATSLMMKEACNKGASFAPLSSLQVFIDMQKRSGKAVHCIPKHYRQTLTRLGLGTGLSDTDQAFGHPSIVDTMHNTFHMTGSDVPRSIIILWGLVPTGTWHRFKVGTKHEPRTKSLSLRNLSPPPIPVLLFTRSCLQCSHIVSRTSIKFECFLGPPFPI